MPAPEIYDENWFWAIIEQAGRSRALLSAILKDLTEKQIYQFQDYFIEFSVGLTDDPYAEHMESSEDGIEDISHWVVSGGKEYYEEILNDPKKIPYTVEGLNEGNLYGVANEVYYSLFHKTLDIY